MPQNFFDTQVAETYDDDPAMFAPEVVSQTVDFLAQLAGGGPALELASGTGRIALPLAARGVPVHGIELSQAMTDRLRAKAGAKDVHVTHGDMTTTRLDRAFTLVYLVYNTINNLTTQDAQIACFENAAAHLERGGHFVVEVGVPALQRLPLGERFVPFHIGEKHWGVDEYDVVTQDFWSHHLHLGTDTARRNSVPFRYVWPSELDLMARLAGMRPAGRFGSWDRSPFTATSPSHVSVWVKD